MPSGYLANGGIGPVSRQSVRIAVAALLAGHNPAKSGFNSASSAHTRRNRSSHGVGEGRASTFPWQIIVHSHGSHRNSTHRPILGKASLD
jgi:hypothetical protein